MTAAEFRAKRRQKFLTEQYYFLNKKWLAKLLHENSKLDESGLTIGDLAYAGVFGSIFKERLNILKLEYTAGSPIETLKPLYADVTKALGEWHAVYHQFRRHLAKEYQEDIDLDVPPLEFDNILDYQLVLDVVSLGILLGEGNTLRQIALWMESERGTDLLFESLLAPTVPDPRDNKDFCHLEPYDPLIDAFYTAKTPAESSAKVKEYLGIWYQSFDGAPWHDGHLHATSYDIPYYGYWSFESAAVCVINGIDDSTFRDHILYSKDLADWARDNNSLAYLKPGAASSSAGIPSRPNVPANHPCPETGWWFTPAKAGSRCYFTQGAIMPNIEGSAYGATFWQWSPDQSAPTL
ncbi:MAG: DUF1911 domain-containing protein [Azonexus sp.]|jgi:hypothetical protein|nr:DUF1911 domain-containing protein [Azonexus sp.]